MDHTTQKFIEQLRSVTLSAEERAVMRAALLARVRELPTREPIVSQWWVWFVHARRFQAAVLSLIIVVGYGSAATFASESSLPGDILYPIKTFVAEPLARLVVPDVPDAKANFETGLLDERLHEAEALDQDMLLASGTPLQKTVRQAIQKQSKKAETVVRDAVDEESRGKKATTAATADPVVREKQRGSPDGEEHGAERALNGVFKEHKHILEKLDIDGRRSVDKGARDE